MKTIYLIGFMGSGKTSVGNQLAKKLSLPLYDTDAYIEKWCQMSIPEIFQQYGEETFRNYEHTVLTKLETENTIIATGGGIVENNQNVEWLKKQFLVVYLDTSWEQIVERLQEDRSRPLWNNDQLDKQMLLQKRQATYSEIATIKVVTDQKTPQEIAEEIITRIKMD